MQNWKKALCCGALGAGTVMTLKGRRTAGVATIAGGLALLASEYPERFEGVLSDAPEYMGRASKAFSSLVQMGERLVEGSETREKEVYTEFV